MNTKVPEKLDPPKHFTLDIHRTWSGSKCREGATGHKHLQSFSVTQFIKPLLNRAFFNA